MQDFFSTLCPLNTSPELWEKAFLRSINEEDYVKSPEKMYTLSLRTQKRLPDRLHEAMVMWSFDPAQSAYVKMYIDWVDHCEEMNAARERLERQQINHDRMLFCMMVLSGISLAFLLAFEIFK